MRKLYRTALFAGVLAFGVAACGDDVQIVDPEPTPPPPLQVTLTPSNASATVGETATFAVGVSGGDSTVDPNWTCASSNTSVATVSTTDAGCSATAVSAGNASITVTVTRGGQSSNAGAQLTVSAVADDPATLSIQSVTQGGTTNPVDISNVQGQIDVTLNLRDNDETPTQVDVLIDGQVAASQVFTSAMLAEMVEEAEAAGADVQTITLSVNTARYDVDPNAFTATARYENGERVIGAQVHVEEREAPRSASNTIEVVFNNSNTFHVLASRDGIATAMDSNGLRWYGGPDFEITVYPIPVMYDGEVVVSMSAQLNNGDGATCSAPTDTEAPFSFTFTCGQGTGGAVEAAGFVPVVTSTVTESGESGPTSGLGADMNIANVSVSADHPFPMRIDVRPPAADGSIVIVRQSGLENVGNWVNNEYNFMQSGAYTRPSDGGVGGVTETISIRDLEASATISAGDLVESVTNERYRLRAVAQDALGNTRTINQTGNDPWHPENTFGYDVTAPDYELEGLGQLEDTYNFAEQFTADDGIEIRATDILSGFAEETAAQHALISIRGQFQGEGAIETAAIVAASPAGISATPFAAARADNNIANLAMVGTTFVDHIDQTAFQVRIDDIGGLVATPRTDAPARYYLYQIRLRDQAGNTTKAYRAVYLNNFSQPVVQNLSNPSTFDAMTTFEASLARDSVELLEGSLEVRYPSTGGTIVWERPTADISSELRMHANILDGELFNDVIYRPQMDVEFPLGFDAMGLQFLKNVQTMADGTDDAKPDSVRARVFNGFGADDEDLNHSADPAGGSGFSSLISNAIVDEEIAGASVVFNELHEGNWIFEIVEGDGPGVVDCNAEYCVRAIGPRSTFTNPFAGGPVFVAWADDAGTGVGGELQWRVLDLAEANFNHPFPTRDSGNDRIYEWEFDTGGINTGGALTGELAIAAIGVNANTGDGLLTAQFFDPPEPVFNVVFEESSYNVEIDGAAVQMDLFHGTNSTGEGFTVDDCVFIDENGNTLLASPTGLTLTVSGQGCLVDADGTAEPDSWTVQAQVTGVDSGASTAETTVVVGFPDFEISLDPASATVEIPATGSVSQSFEVVVDSPATSTISALNCSLSQSMAGVSVVATAGPPVACVVTVTDDASPGTVTVSATATEDGTGRTDTATATLTLSGVTFTVTPDPAEIDWLAGVEIALDVGGTRSNADIDHVASTCSIDSGDMTAAYSNDGDDPFCLIEVGDPTAVAEGDEFEVTWTIEYTTDARVDTVVSDAFLGERPVFDPQLDFSLGGETSDDRRIIERDRTAFFEVLSGEGIGINLANSTAVVSPSGGLVTAAVTQDVDGTYLLEVDVPLASDTGNYTVTVTFEEDGTGETKVVLVYITVTDTGTIEVDDGEL